MMTHLGDVVLCWLLARKEKRTVGELKKALAIVGLDEEVERLVQAGLAGRRGARGLELTEAGRIRALGFLGVTAPPAGWQQVKARLVARALGLAGDAAKLLGDADRLRATVLRRDEALRLDDVPTLARAKDALAWKLVGVDSTKPFTRARVLGHFIGQRLGAGRELDGDQAVGLLVARHAAARRDDAHELRAALLRRLLTEQPAETHLDLGDFAQSVVEAARRSETGRFGDDKVFISHVMRRLAVADVADFKAQLVRAHLAGLVALGRADLANLLDPEDVRASETEYLGATYHFVKVEPQK